MDAKTLEAIAEMFRVANEKMAEMTREIKAMTKTMEKVRNPWPDYLWEAGGGGYRRRKKVLKNAESPVELFNAITKPKNYNNEYTEFNPTDKRGSQ